MVLLIAVKTDPWAGCLSSQLLVLSSGLLQNGDVGVRVFPEREEILVSSARAGWVAREHSGAGQPQVRERV